MKANRVYIFDTTLRDGQQSPGAGMSLEDNIRYAEYANLLKIDVLEAGFPAASQTDFQIVNAISQKMTDKDSAMIIAALCQLREEQFIKTMQALSPSLQIRKARIHTYVPVDPNLMQASLGQLAENKSKIIAEVYRLILLATQAGFEVEFTPEGYSRMGSHFDFTTALIRAAISAGAHVINCPDTIGGAASIQGEDYFVRKMQQHANTMAHEFPNKEIIWSAHCHNDFGLALNNSMNAVFAGPARQIEGCMNGVGERAGNAALEQCIMYLKHFGAMADQDNPFYTDINLNYLKETSDFIAAKMLPRQPHASIVGDNAARHSSGGHTNAILKNPLAYQPFDPKQIGGEITFAFGPLSGSNHAKQIIEKYGYYCSHDEKTTITQAIKDYYADRRKGITDEELIKAYKHFRAPIKVVEISYSKTYNDRTCLLLAGKFFDRENVEIHCDENGSPLAALLQKVRTFLPGLDILDFQSNSSDKRAIDEKCLSKVTIRTNENKKYQGEAMDMDVEISVLKAFTNAVNQAYIDINFQIKDEEYA